MKNPLVFCAMALTLSLGGVTSLARDGDGVWDDAFPVRHYSSDSHVFQLFGGMAEMGTGAGLGIWAARSNPRGSSMESLIDDEAGKAARARIEAADSKMAAALKLRDDTARAVEMAEERIRSIDNYKKNGKEVWSHSTTVKVGDVDVTTQHYDTVYPKGKELADLNAERARLDAALPSARATRDAAKIGAGPAELKVAAAKADILDAHKSGRKAPEVDGVVRKARLRFAGQVFKVAGAAYAVTEGTIRVINSFNFRDSGPLPLATLGYVGVKQAVGAFSADALIGAQSGRNGR